MKVKIIKTNRVDPVEMEYDSQFIGNIYDARLEKNDFGEIKYICDINNSDVFFDIDEVEIITDISLHNNRLIGHIQFESDNGFRKSIKTNHHYKYYDSIFQAMEIASKKNHDYAGNLSTDPLANFKRAEECGLTAFQGLWMRSLDKVNRINTFMKEGKLEVSSESVEDALMDLGNYCFLGLAILHDNKPNLEKDKK